MSKKVDLQNVARNFYMCFLVIYMIVREVIPLQFLIDSIFVSAFVFLAGFSLVIWDLLTDRDCLKGKAIDFLVVFLIICVISSILHYRYGIGSNIKCIAAMVLEYFVFFPMGLKKNRQKTLTLCLQVLIVTLFVFVLVSVLMYFFSIDYAYIWGTRVGVQGFVTAWGRLWGVFGDPNVICYVSLVSIFSSGYFMYRYQKAWSYILYGVNILLQLLFLVLAASRSGLLLMVLMPIVSAVYILLGYSKTDRKKAFCGTAAVILVPILLLGGYFGLKHTVPSVKAFVLNTAGNSVRESVIAAYDRFYQSVGVEIQRTEVEKKVEENSQINADNTPLDDNAAVEEINRKDDKTDISNGRFERWRAGLEVFKTTPIFGASPRNAVAIAQERTPDTVMGKYGWVTHCAYLEILVNTGILGFVVMLSLLVYIAVRFWKAAASKGFDVEIYLAFLCFITIAAGAFFVSDIFFVFSIGALLFFYLLGYLYGSTQEEKNGILYRVFSRLRGRADK